MNMPQYDAIVIGSGAGGAADAKLRAGFMLMPESGDSKVI